MIKKHLLLFLALVLGIFTRSYHYLDRFNYAHDNDVAAWIVKDMVIDKHVRLVGQMTSVLGVYIGGLWYYLQIPFYKIGQMDPIYTPVLALLVGVAAIGSVYWVVTQVWGRRSGQIAALLYAVSWSISGSERLVVPTTLVFLWSIWFIYALHFLLRGERKGLWIVAILWGLIWHVNLTLAALVPLVIGVLVYRHKFFKWRDVVGPVMLVVIMSLPLLVFEARHNFGQLQAILGAGSSTPITIPGQLQQIFLYSAKNANNLFWVKPDSIGWYLVPIGLLLVGAYLVKIKLISYPWAQVMFGCGMCYLLFFLFIPINLSEYYLDGLSILWIIILAVWLATLWTRWRLGVMILIGVIVGHNLVTVVGLEIDDSGYRQKKAIANYIAQDASAHNYPCVAISYMTDQGRDLGYRYWFWLAGLKVKTPASLAPVYTIVFPHTRAGRLDKSFGAIGLVYPDYYQYTKEAIATSCLGDNENLTLPMPNFTK